MDSPYIGRVVTLLSPVFAGLAGSATLLAAKYLPGAPALDSTELTALFSVGFTGALGLLFKWLDNRGKWEVAQTVGAESDDPAVRARVATLLKELADLNKRL